MEPDKTQIAPDDLQHLAQTLDIKLKEADLAKRQSDLAGGGLWKTFSSSPLSSILLTALAGLLATLLSSYLQLRQTLQSEHEKLKITLIQKATDNDDPLVVSKRLLFYLNMGLIDDPNGNIRLLETRPFNAPANKIVVPNDKNSKAS